MRILQIIIYFAMAFFLFACSMGSDVYAPVTDVETIESIPKTGVHRVQSGETLYSIAWRYGLDYRSVAKRNHLSSPYTIHVGQVIYLKGHAAYLSPRSIQTQEREPVVSVTKWVWPAHGPIIGEYSALNKGLNIGGHLGDPIYATAAGKVVYCGDGLRGYGNLIIIKHNSTYLSAYAHNSIVYVKSGEWVRQGQKIAEMGKTGAQRIMLHFEIRRNGLSENPLVYLPVRT